MKKIVYLSLGCLTLLMLVWCAKKTMMQVSFDHYTLQRDTNGKAYTPLASQPWSIAVYQAQQVTTGAANSFIVSQMVLPAGTDLLNVVTLNDDQLAKKLVSYKWSKPTKSKITCNGANLTGYTTTFTYELDAQTFHVYQYYFMENNTLQLISFQADNSKDLTATANSIKSLTCLKSW